MDKQQAPNVQHKELYSIAYDKKKWKRMFYKNIKEKKKLILF